MRAAAFTIVAKNYLPYARVLMASLRTWAPELRRVVILVDRPDGYFDPAQEDFELIRSDALAIPNCKWFHFKYTILELSTAVKPYAARHLLDQYGLDELLYFDPDIRIYNSLRPVFEALACHDIVLTPHLTAPLTDDRRPSDLDILRSGAYNLGFLAMRNSAESRRFLEWWAARLYDHCVVDLANGLFVDQRWVDLVPGMFDGVVVVRDPGLNVAYWNLANRQVSRRADTYLVNTEPLRFFHYSGFDPERPHGVSRHQNRLDLNAIGDAKELFLDYRQRLLDSGYAECKSWPYAYGAFENGFPIPDMGRPAHHECPEVVAKVADPFSAAGYESFVEIWNNALAGPDGKPSGITRLAYRIYRSRTDVQLAMPDIFSGDLIRFLKWVLTSGVREHQLGEVFVAPIRSAVREHDTAAATPQRDRAPVVNEKIIAALKENGIWVDSAAAVSIEQLNRLIGNGDARFHLSGLSKAIYQSRPDLQNFFPDPTGRDGIRFLAWFLTYGAREYRIAEVLLAPLRTQWSTVLASLENPIQRSWYRLILQAMSGSLKVRDGAGLVAARFHLSQAALASRRAPRAGRASQESNTGEPPPPEPGINFVGYAYSEMGVGESIRCASRAALAAGLPFAIRNVDSDGPYRRQDRSVPIPEAPCRYATNIFHVNADQSDAVVSHLGGSFLRGRYNIGFWAWELEEFPDRWANAFRYFREIWTPSTFCQTAISRKSVIPVVWMPHAIEVRAVPAASRGPLGIADGAVVFLAAFDVLSVFERKNPLGMLAAFRAAFDGCRSRHLVLKVNHGEQRPAEMARIVEAAAGLPVTIVDRTVDRDHVTALMNMADCLVSLHRSEGFGLTLAEAMYLGKPVIATAYSGNLDFTDSRNAFLVDYALVPVGEGCQPYDPGRLWAEPQLGSAVAQMRLAASSQAERSERGRRGQERIKEQFSPHAVGRRMIERLNAVGAHHG